MAVEKVSQKPIGLSPVGETDRGPLRRRLRRWRRVQIAAGLVLASTFFMPAVRGCNAPVIPAFDAYDVFSHWRPDLLEWLVAFLFFVVAYLFGAVVTVLAVRRMRWEKLPGPHHGLIVFIISEVIAVTTICTLAWVLHDDLPEDWEGWLLAVFVVVYFAYWLRAVRRQFAGFLGLQWATAVGAVAWFSFHAMQNTAYYGLKLALGASAVIAVATFAEARALAGRRFWPAVGDMLLARLTPVEPDEPRCGECGYLLIGLTTPRCPECGQEFEPAGGGGGQGA